VVVTLTKNSIHIPAAKIQCFVIAKNPFVNAASADFADKD